MRPFLRTETLHFRPTRWPRTDSRADFRGGGCAVGRHQPCPPSHPHNRRPIPLPQGFRIGANPAPIRISDHKFRPPPADRRNDHGPGRPGPAPHVGQPPADPPTPTARHLPRRWLACGDPFKPRCRPRCVSISQITSGTRFTRTPGFVSARDLGRPRPATVQSPPVRPTRQTHDAPGREILSSARPASPPADTHRPDIPGS